MLIESQKEVQEFKLLLNTHAKVQKDITYENLKTLFYDG
jgi:hypothetical protein